MPALTLRIQPDGTVALPAALLLGPLTLTQIGAIFVWAAVGELAFDDEADSLAACGLRDARLTSEEFLKATREIARLRIIKPRVDGTTVTAEFNLDPVMPPQAHFPIK